MKSHLAIGIALLTGGCAGALKAPGPMDIASDTPAAWTVSLPASGAAAVGATDWLAQFGSEQLAALVDEALSVNPDIRAADATARAARANAAAAFGRRLPSLTAQASAGSTANGDAILTPDGESYGLGATASWEADLWGRVSATVRAARADALASDADLRAVRLSIAGAAANSWISLANASAQLALARRERDIRQRSRELTERRFAAGISSSLDVRLARSAEASSRAGIASAERDLADAARSLEILLGRYPAAAVKGPDLPPQLDAMADLSDPADLLMRRPDLAAAEARFVAAGFRADAARAALRPSLTLSASAGTNTADSADLLDPNYLARSVLASLTAPLFNGGALRAQSRAARAQAEAASALYASAALTAWREVESARAADLSLAAQEDALADAFEQADAARILAERQYQQGLISIFDLINAQSQSISAERQLLNARTGRAANRVTYHLALGGGDLVAPALPDGPVTP